MTSQDLSVAIDRLLLWSSQRQLKIANKKCLVLRRSNHRCISSCLHPTYSINVHFLSEVRDLGVIVDSSLKLDKHLSLIVRKAQQRAGLILKRFCSRDLFWRWGLFVHMSDHYWNTPHPFGLHIISILFSKLKTSSVLILNVWQAWKIFYYLERLKALGISSLERRRLERDLILCYNLFHGICEIRLPFKLDVSVTRGNSCKLVKTSCNTNDAKYFYTDRIVFAWNSLSDTVVTGSFVNAFRKQLNAVNLKKFIIVG